MLGKEIGYLLKNEIRQEWRQPYALGGILLYVGAAVFVIHLIFKGVAPDSWNTLFWLVALFAAIQAVAKSFITESRGSMLYYYTIVSPQAVIFSKMIYNTLLLLLLMLMGYLGFSLVLGNPVLNKPLFLLAAVLGCMGFSFLLSLVSAIAAKANNKSTLMAILALPLALPVLLLAVDVANDAVLGMSIGANTKNLLLLGCLNAMIMSIGYLLFPYLWRD